MIGSPPFTLENLVTLENWQRASFNRWSFQHVRELIPTARIPRGNGPVWKLPRAERDLTSVRFATRSGELTVGQHLDETYTDGFLVIHQGRIITERYFNGLRPDMPHLLMSVSKSLTGLVVGALAAEACSTSWRRLRRSCPSWVAHPSRARPCSNCSICGRAPTSCRITTIRTGTLRSATGCTCGGAMKASRAPPTPSSSLPRSATTAPHGGAFQYRSVLTDVLAWVLEKAGRARFSDLVAGELWQPMGAEHDAEVTVDGHGNALADGGISATLRDAGRVRLLACAAAGHETRGSSPGPGSTTPSGVRRTVRGRSGRVTGHGAIPPALTTATAGGSLIRSSRCSRRRESTARASSSMSRARPSW